MILENFTKDACLYVLSENRYRYIARGSLLGITLKHTFIPMGSIDEIKSGKDG